MPARWAPREGAQSTRLRSGVRGVGLNGAVDYFSNRLRSRFPNGETIISVQLPIQHSRAGAL
jgi:hypothetical protein